MLEDGCEIYRRAGTAQSGDSPCTRGSQAIILRALDISSGIPYAMGEVSWKRPEQALHWKRAWKRAFGEMLEKRVLLVRDAEREWYNWSVLATGRTFGELSFQCGGIWSVRSSAATSPRATSFLRLASGLAPAALPSMARRSDALPPSGHIGRAEDASVSADGRRAGRGCLRLSFLLSLPLQSGFIARL